MNTQKPASPWTSAANLDKCKLAMTAAQWRAIDADRKTIEDGQRYLLRLQDGHAHLLRVELVGV